jgi:hypothetical protein
MLTQPRSHWEFQVNRTKTALPLAIDWFGTIPYGAKLVSIELCR